jgi:hypothetical protein
VPRRPARRRGRDVVEKRDGEGDLGDLSVYEAEWKDEYSLLQAPDGAVPTPANPVFAPDSAPPRTDGPDK